MGADSKIEWTHHSFNPWWGCARVSPGCEHCYAEAMTHCLNNHLYSWCLYSELVVRRLP